MQVLGLGIRTWARVVHGLGLKVWGLSVGVL